MPVEGGADGKQAGSQLSGKAQELEAPSIRESRAIRRMGIDLKVFMKSS